MHPRNKTFSNLAAAHGFSFHRSDNYGLASQLQDFQLFRAGRSRSIDRILRKQDGLMEFDISIFDYSYRRWTGSGQQNRVHQTVFFLQSASLSLPELYMKPETLTHKLGELFGFPDIDFVRFPKFSGQYRLTGEDETYIRHHFTDEVLTFFTEHRGWTMEGLGFYLLFYRKGMLVPPAEIEAFYRRGQEVYRLLTDKTAQHRIFGT